MADSISGENFSDTHESQQRMFRLRESIEFLQEYQPYFLETLENARRDQVPFILHVEGYEHSSNATLALLRSAHAFGVHVTIVPYPISRIVDSPGDQRTL